jgi:hypothetical protein
MYKALIICAAAAVLWLGCGVDDEPLRPRAVGESPSKLAAMSPEEREAYTAKQDARANEIFERMDGTPGDAEPDYRACRLELLKDPAFVNGSGLGRAIATAKCMKEKGWVVKPEKRGESS